MASLRHRDAIAGMGGLEEGKGVLKLSRSWGDTFGAGALGLPGDALIPGEQ